ncbi:MAG: hypothetical protein PWP31_1381, partial [Clostridia bacterium]|nr:hypothetical protein [Clostridia bacterium]
MYYIRMKGGIFLQLKKYLAIIVTLILMTTMATGCGLTDRLKARNQSDVQVQIPPPEANILPETEEIQPNISTTQVDLYFIDSEGKYLVKETREIPKVESIARETINELINGPGPESNLLPSIPAGTVLKDINIKSNGLCRVDFSKELIENHNGSSLGENLTVYSIVNTLTQFPSVEKVRLLVEGQYVES